MSAEQHVYPPPPEAVKGAWVSGMAAYQALSPRRSRLRGLLGAPGARADLVAKPFTRVLNAERRRSSSGSRTAR